MINELIKTSMKNGDKTMLDAYRSIKTKILNELTKKGKQPENDATLFQSMVKKEIKEREEANSFIKENTDNEILAKNQIIIQTLKSHLPQVFSKEEQLKCIDQAIETSKATSQKDMGKVMAQLSNQKDQLDMKFVSMKVKEKLSKLA